MKKISLLFGALLVLATLTGCGSSGQGGGGTTSSDTIFYDAVQEVMPVIVPAGSSSIAKGAKAVNSEWEIGNPLYEIFYLLREFNPDTDQGVIDTSNLYKTMWESKNFLSNTRANCQAITEQEITPPFDFGNAAVTYNCAFNNVDDPTGYDFGGAMKDIDSNGTIVPIDDSFRTSTTARAKYGLFGFVWVDSGDNPHNEYGTLQAEFDASTNDLSVDIAVWVDYTTENDYCYRNDISGNSSTHAFTFRSMKGNKVEGSTYLSVVGSGYSEGAGKYFLLRVFTNDIDGKYYCIPAGAGETELQNMDANGSSTVGSNCAEFEATVNALTPLAAADLVCESSDFNPGGTGTAAEGTIYLNYQ